MEENHKSWPQVVGHSLVERHDPKQGEDHVSRSEKELVQVIMDRAEHR